MFGHQDDKHDDNTGDEPQQDAATTEVTPDKPTTDNQPDDSQQSHSQDDHDAPAGDISSDDSKTPAEDDKTDEPTPKPDDNDDDSWQHPGEPIDDGPEQISDIIAPAGGHPGPSTPMPLDARDVSDDDGKTPHELIDIKQKALGELQPLMGELDQSPEDKFRTIMMIIQASDNQDMIKQAYEAADAIKDEKAKAQALLDIVNEINYFTQHPQQQ